MAPSFPQPPFIIAEKYHVEKVLGRGGMGVVYRAKQDPLKRFVAIKMILGDLNDDAEFVARFKQEAVTVAHLSHGGIVAIHDVVMHEGNMCIVMEYVEGRTLDSVMRAQRLYMPRALALGARMADTLHFCHRRGIIHRDIKPENVMLLEGDEVKVMDFGIAKAADSSVKTQTGTALGTPKYMSPEQAQGHKNLDARSDVYSLGCVLYEMVTGRVPFEGDQSLAIAIAHVREQPQPPRAFNEMLHPEVETIILRCLAKNPSDRPADMSVLAAELRRLATLIATDPEMQASPGTEVISPQMMEQHLSKLGSGFVAPPTGGLGQGATPASTSAPAPGLSAAWERGGSPTSAPREFEPLGGRGTPAPTGGQQNVTTGQGPATGAGSVVPAAIGALVAVVGGGAILFFSGILGGAEKPVGVVPTPTPVATVAVVATATEVPAATPAATPRPTEPPATPAATPTPTATPTASPTPDLAAMVAREAAVIAEFTRHMERTIKQLEDMQMTLEDAANSAQVRDGLAILERGLRENKDSPSIQLALAEFHIRLGRKSDAARYLRQLKTNPRATKEERDRAVARLEELGE